MAQPYIGEIRMFAGNFAPVGWQFCDGRELPITQAETLFQLIGTTFGGDGQQTFALPNLSGRVPLHAGTGQGGTTYQLADMGGVEDVTLTPAQMPPHSHPQAAATPATKTSPLGNVSADAGLTPLYAAGTGTSELSPLAMSSVGGTQPHNNLMPYCCVTYIISLSGVFPSAT
jgi:microcystin-dependent protein